MSVAMTKIAFFALVILASSPAFAGSDHYGSAVETRTTAIDLMFTGSISRHDLEIGRASCRERVLMPV